MQVDIEGMLKYEQTYQKIMKEFNTFLQMGVPPLVAFGNYLEAFNSFLPGWK